MQVALGGLAAILSFKLAFDPSFHFVEHLVGSAEHEGEWRILLNLAGLLLGFAVLAKHFEESKIPLVLPAFLPDDWKGGFVAAIVAASNAGGSGSVVGDTTTTMMWIEGVPATEVLPAYFAAVPALLIFGISGAVMRTGIIAS